MPETAVQQRHEALKVAGIDIEVSPAPVKVIEPLPEGMAVKVAPLPRKEVDRVKYVCGGCAIKGWAASESKIECRVCSIAFVTDS